MSPATIKPGWCDTLNTKKLDFLFLLAFLSFFFILSVAVPARSEAEQKNANFVKVSYNPRIPAGAKAAWTFVIYNANCSENGQNMARFFIVLYTDNELLLNEYNDTQYKTWSCNKTDTVTRNYNIRAWQDMRPTSHDLRAELYWTDNSTFRLEDTTSFTVNVVVHIPLQHILATGYFAAYLIVCFVLFYYVYVKGLDD
jgi:hypothetical protein